MAILSTRRTTSRPAARALVTLAGLLVLAAGCGTGGQVDGAPAPTQTPSASSSSSSANPFTAADHAMAQMVDANAAWHVRRTVPVDQTQDVGLSVGQTDELTRQIEDNLPQTESVPAGTLQVGTDVTAALVGDPSDVQIRPDQAIDASTGSAVGLLWTWKVRALHPTKDLHLTAHLAMLVPGTDHRLTRDVPLHLTVQRTASYTAHQIFTHWATWAAIVTAAAGVARWLWVRLRRRRAGHATDRDSPDGTAGPTVVSPAAY